MIHILKHFYEQLSNVVPTTETVTTRPQTLLSEFTMFAALACGAASKIDFPSAAKNNEICKTMPLEKSLRCYSKVKSTKTFILFLEKKILKMMMKKLMMMSWWWLEE